MFFWFFPAQNGNKPDTPVMLWLQGGPGASSLFGLFTEIGPIYIDANGNIQSRPISWNGDYHLVFIDNPVGTGYSFTSNDAGYAKSQDDVARDLYSALTQFFQIYTDYASNPFIVTGESYAGHYVPSITYKIHVENQNPQVKVKINLKGMSIGDGLTDPYNQYDYGSFLYQVSSKPFFFTLVDLFCSDRFDRFDSKSLRRLANGDDALSDRTGQIRRRFSHLRCSAQR